MAQEEKTFRSYTEEQGKTYAAVRTGYPPALFKYIVDHHTSTGGQLDTVVDIGCGPGQAIRGLAPYFAHAIGLDPSEGMIGTARAISAAEGSTVRFEMSMAETLGAELDPPIAEGSVDLLTAATAAHWFDMARFWPRAARVLKPGGTVAMWTAGSLYVDADATPNGAAIQAAIEDAMRGEQMRPYISAGNLMTRGLYVDLPLPWTIENPAPEFDEATFFRKEWNRKGVDGRVEDEAVFDLKRKATPGELEKRLSTGSPVTRWRQANPDKAGTDEDIIQKLTRKVESLFHEAGVKPGEEMLVGGVAAVLLMVKKKAA
ncbi:S-adenosyl-L-methionine-dependent methyltransferase [Hypoxylon crocopeplum]|nr:S-adenosyl-L-methionine-dependent methyltransferase [Hypoxylon crocopeplum]